MHRFLYLALLITGLTAANPPKDVPPDPEPPPPPPPPPVGTEEESALEPQVTIRKQGADTIEEVRINGKLVVVKVTPAHGVAYYLVPERGDGKLLRQESLDSGLRVPMWLLLTF